MATDSLDMTSNDWRIVRENLVQLHCENVSWEQASDEIPLDLVRYLLGDLVQHLSTLVFLRGNRCLFTINWTHIPDSISVWENLLSDFFDKRIQTQVGHYRFTYMLSYVGPKYDDLVNVYCHAHWGSPHPSFRREDVNYAFQKATKVANQQASKYKSSYDKSIKGPQLQEKDLVLVKILAHKGRHKLQDKWEPEEYVVVEQPIAGTPVYRVQPVTGGNIRTLHRNLLLPLGVKLEPDYDSDDSILEEDDSSSDEVEILEDNRKKVSDKRNVESRSQTYPKGSKHVEFDSNVDIFSSPEVQSNITDSKVRSEAVVEDATVDVETTSDDVIPADISLPSQFLLPNLDDSSSNEETEVTELYTEVEPTINDSGKEMQSINSEADSLVDTKELLEFIDTMDVRDASKVTESDTQEESVHDVTRQDDIDPKSESQFSSFMSYHEGESSSLDPGTNGQELSKSPIEDSTKRHDSGVVDQGDINSYDSDMIAYESNNTCVPSIDISDHSNMDSQSRDMTDNTSVNPIVDVEVEPVRRSARQRKQTQFYGNPWLYRIACNLTPWGLTELLQHSLSDMK